MKWAPERPILPLLVQRGCLGQDYPAFRSRDNRIQFRAYMVVLLNLLEIFLHDLDTSDFSICQERLEVRGGGREDIKSRESRVYHDCAENCCGSGWGIACPRLLHEAIYALDDFGA